MIENARDVVGDSGHYFATSGGRQFGEKRGHKLTTDIGEGVAVEKEERSAAMTLPQKIQGFVEREG